MCALEKSQSLLFPQGTLTLVFTLEAGVAWVILPLVFTQEAEVPTLPSGGGNGSKFSSVNGTHSKNLLNEANTSAGIQVERKMLLLEVVEGCINNLIRVTKLQLVEKVLFSNFSFFLLYYKVKQLRLLICKTILFAPQCLEHFSI